MFFLNLSLPEFLGLLGSLSGVVVALYLLDRMRKKHTVATLRFFALRMHEAGFIEASPNKVIAEGTDWRFLDELKRELKT